MVHGHGHLAREAVISSAQDKHMHAREFLPMSRKSDQAALLCDTAAVCVPLTVIMAAGAPRIGLIR